MRIPGAIALLAALASPARAAETVQCTATEIVATNEKKGLDPRLEGLKSKLGTPQFRVWDTFKLVGETRLAVEKQKPATAQIQYGRLTLLLKDREGASARARLHMGVDLDDKSGRRQISMSAKFDTDDHLLLTGIQFQGGTYILAIGCTLP
jgi:hypothetical protein